MNDKVASTNESENIEMLPILPLRDVVVYPHMVIPLFVGREKSIRGLDVAMQTGKQIFLVAQKSAAVDSPSEDDLYQFGTVATILQLLKLPDGTVKVLVEGISRGEIVEFHESEEYQEVQVEILDEVAEEIDITHDAEMLMHSLSAQFDQYVKLNKKIPPEILASLANIEDAGRLSDTVAAHMTLKIESKQKILEAFDLVERLQLVLQLLDEEVELLMVEKRIQGRVKTQMEKSQREYYLNEKMKAIQKELDVGEDGESLSDMEQLKRRIEQSKMSKDAKEKALAEFNKLKMMPPMSAEATVSRNYLDWLLDVPWKKYTKVNHDLEKAEEILSEDHYGLEKVKERILEYLAVQERVGKCKGAILCLVGPPGVGKTSLGESIARATGRKFTRFSLGGVRDEAEIRGHRRTYIGALPGKIMQRLAKVKKCNPLFMLDEVDKMAMDFRGDPASALLEVLDSEQNDAFGDHYLEVDYDLSDVMFIATANSLDIPLPLLDRMEVINLPGYTEEEKLNICMRYLVPKQKKLTGLKDDEVSISKGVLHDIIRYYTREAGVRSLEREISKICRKVVKEISISKKKKPITHISVTSKNLTKYLGVRKYRFGIAEESDQVGQVTGLAWTEVGGELLTIESTVLPGKGKTLYTGSLGDVMQESIQAALTVVRSRSDAIGIDHDFYQDVDIHVHVPEGATPKDGPSAGVGMCTALVSALTSIPVKANVAMTGEITLRGEVLPIGGLKEKLLAALRGGITVVVIPSENEKDLKEMPANILRDLEIIPVKWIDEVLDIALATPLKPLKKGGKKKSGVLPKQKTKKSSRQGTTH